MTSEKISKQAGRLLGAKQTADQSSRRRLEEVLREAHQVDTEICPPLPSLPQRSRPTSPPPTSPLSSAEKRGANEVIAITLADRGTLIPEGTRSCRLWVKVHLSVLSFWVYVYKSELSGLQCRHSETRNLSTPALHLLKARRLNSTVTRRPAKFPCMMNQLERAARWGPSGTRTCSERHSRTGPQITERTAPKSCSLKDSHCSTCQRRTGYRQGLSQRPRTSLPRRRIT